LRYLAAFYGSDHSGHVDLKRHFRRIHHYLLRGRNRRRGEHGRQGRRKHPGFNLRAHEHPFLGKLFGKLQLSYGFYTILTTLQDTVFGDTPYINIMAADADCHIFLIYF
jgi:hypothetical protein